MDLESEARETDALEEQHRRRSSPVSQSDDEQLAFSSQHGCVLYTHNASDF
jgi:hypothetical protein